LKHQCLYDFDGTITSQDTTKILLVELVRARPWRICKAGWLLARMYIARENDDKQRLKNQVIGYLIKGLDDARLAPVLRNFRAKIKPLYRSALLKAMRRSIKHGDLVFIVTASPTFAVNGCIDELPVTVLGTEFEQEKNIYTGRLSGKNCYGYEKVQRIAAWCAANNMELNVKSAWSDHFSDFEVVGLAQNRYWLGGARLREQVLNCDPEANFVDLSN
jgi:phosphatidylglycerophosphatase C